MDVALFSQMDRLCLIQDSGHLTSCDTANGTDIKVIKLSAVLCFWGFHPCGTKSDWNKAERQDLLPDSFETLNYKAIKTHLWTHVSITYPGQSVENRSSPVTLFPYGASNLEGSSLQVENLSVCLFVCLSVCLKSNVGPLYHPRITQDPT